MNSRADRRLLERVFRAGLAGVEPAQAVSRALLQPPVARLLRRARNVGVFAVGKAAAAMIRGVSGLQVTALVVLPRGYPPVEFFSAEILFASHPEPDSSSVQAALRALRFFSLFGPEDVIL